MTLSTLKLTNFRSYEDREFAFDPRSNVIVGPNGSGKTNILEAIYMLGVTRSFRGLPQQIVYTGQDWFRVHATNTNGDDIAVAWKNKQKHFSYNTKEVKPQTFIGSVPVVLFEPGSLHLVYGAPRERRQLLDRILSFTDRQYLTSLLQLRRILKQRNSVLRKDTLKKDQVFGWDVLLVEQAEYIRSRREELLQYLNSRVPEVYKDIAGSDDQIAVTYSSKTANDSYTDELLRQLEALIDTDYKYGSTSAGPHRDDVKIAYNGQPFAEVGSRGEIRTVVVSFVLAELEYLRHHAGSEPLLLLDDVFSELDETRQSALLDYVGEVQTIATATHPPQQLQTGYATIEL